MKMRITKRVIEPWLASQGSITLFVILIFVYAFKMNGLDRKYGFEDEEE